MKPATSTYQSSTVQTNQSNGNSFVPQSSYSELPRLPGVDEDLLMYFSNMSDEEIMEEYQMVVMQMMGDPDIGVALQYLTEHPDDIMGAASNPTVAAGIQKMQNNPTFATLQYLVSSRRH